MASIIATTPVCILHLSSCICMCHSTDGMPSWATTPQNVSRIQSPYLADSVYVSKPCRTEICGVVRWRHLHQLRVHIYTVTSVAVTVAHALLCDISREAQYFDILVFIMTRMECITSQAFSWETWGKLELPFPRFHCDAAVVIRYVSQLITEYVLVPTIKSASIKFRR